MAALANTVLTTAAVGNREELSNIVSMITPTDTPIYSMAGKEKLSSKHPEWEYEALRSPAENAQPEGNEFDFDAQVAPTRVGNYTQIFRDTWIYSGTQQAVDNAGNQEKAAKAKVKAGINVRKDIEFAIVSNTASVATGVRYSGGLPSWLTTNVSRSGSNGGFSSGTGLTVAETTGAQRAFTKTLTDTVMQAAYQAGANVTDVVVSPYVKSVFVTFMSDSNVAAFRYAADKGGKNTIVGTADIYEGPFGKVTVKPNRVMSTSATARRAFFLDPEMIAWGSLRPIQEAETSKTGDSEKGVILGEGTLLVKNEAGLGVVADLYGLTSGS
jgi:hypothetical protein